VVRGDGLYSGLIGDLKRYSYIKATIMEVCGTHTMAISRYGIRSLLPEGVRLISGPGCPVCVTEPGAISTAVQLAESGVTLVTFGDMMRVPSARGSLYQARAKGADVRIAYSPLDALNIAVNNKDISVCFFAVGFETTIPGISFTLKRAIEEGIDNFSMLTSLRTIPPAMEVIVKTGEAGVDGFIAPGHVSTIIGSEAYRDIAEKYGVPTVVSGFSAGDILTTVSMILDMIESNESEVRIQYEHVVKPEGNIKAMKMMYEYFNIYDIGWRGLGIIEKSGLKIKEEYSAIDALCRYDIEIEEEDEPEGCLCGDVLAGRAIPPDCSLFGGLCTPSKPVGPCMVSSEGSCAAYYKYGGDRVRYTI